MAKKQPVSINVRDAIEQAVGVAGELRDELQEWRDNLPENLQNGQKAEELDEAIGYLNEVADGSTEDYDALEELAFQYFPETRRNPPRRVRRDEATQLLDLAISEIESWCEANVDHNDHDEISSYRDTLEGWRDTLDGVEFPGAR